MLVHIVSKPFDLYHMRWNDSVGKKFLTEKMFNRQFSVNARLIRFCDTYHYYESTKQLKNELKKKERCKTCNMCLINARNTT